MRCNGWEITPHAIAFEIWNERGKSFDKFGVAGEGGKAQWQPKID